MPRVTRDGVSLYYEREEADGESVVFLQGFGYGRWMWRWQREALRGEYDVIAPDTRGTGRSQSGAPPLVARLPGRLRTRLARGPLSYSIGGLTEDLEAVLSDAGVSNAHVVGASLGGMVALEYALEYGRTKTLTLVGTTHGGPDSVAIPEEIRRQVLVAPKGTSEREGIRHAMGPVFTEAFTNRNPHLMDRIIEWRRESDAESVARLAQAGAGLEFDAADRLDRIRCPTLVVHGNEDRVVPVANGRLLAEKIPGARLVEIDGGSHLCSVENAETVTDELRSFLKIHS